MYHYINNDIEHLCSEISFAVTTKQLLGQSSDIRDILVQENIILQLPEHKSYTITRNLKKKRN